MTKEPNRSDSLDVASPNIVSTALLHEWLKDLISNEEDRRLLVMWAEHARAHGEPVALVGAGMSLNADPKSDRRTPEGRTVRAWSWKTLENELKKALGEAGQDGSDPLWLAELYQQAFGRTALMDIVRRAAPSDDLKPGDVHKELVGIPWHTILTTNYDDLIERAKQKGDEITKTIWKDQQLAQPYRKHTETPVIHLHGVLDDPDSIILTLESYRRYPQTHPGLIAKTRQLFMEHPLLMVGFSATDPNFVQWMGWVDDVLRGFAPLHVNLFVSPEGVSPSAARRSYWHDRVRFVPCKLGDLEAILASLGKFFRRIPEPERVQSPTAFAAAFGDATSPSDALSRLNAAWDADPQRKRDHHARMEDIEVVARRLVMIRSEDSDARALMGWLMRTQPHLWPREDGHIPATALPVEPTLDQQRSAIRASFGERWPDILDLVVVDLWEGRFRLLGVEFDLDDEAAALDVVDPRRASLLGQTPWRLLLAKIYRATEWPDADVQAWQTQHGPPSPSQRRELEELRALFDLRGNKWPQPPAAVTSAQGSRRAGFLARLRDDRKATWEYYRSAANLSANEDEDPVVRWATVESARIAAEWYTLNDDDAPPNAAEDAEHWARLGHDLHARWGPDIARRINRRAAASTKHLAELWKLRATPPSRQSGGRFYGDNGDGAQELVEWAEEHWIHPTWIAPSSDVYGSALWRHAQVHDLERDDGSSVLSAAVRVWRRYGSELLAHAVTEIAEFGDPDTSEPQALLQALLQPGRWHHEWINAARALTKVAPALPQSKLAELEQWTLQCETSLKEAARHAAKWSDRRPRASLALRVATYKLHQPRTTVHGLVDLCEKYPWFVASTGLDPAEFPWSDWVTDGHVDRSEAIAALVKLMTAEERNIAVPQQGINTLRTLLQLPKWKEDPSACDAVSRRLSRHAMSDEVHAIVAAHEGEVIANARATIKAGQYCQPELQRCQPKRIGSAAVRSQCSPLDGARVTASGSASGPRRRSALLMDFTV